jgi:hypothetical protein
LGFQKRVWCPKWTPASSISRMDTDIRVSEQGLTSARPCSQPEVPATHPIGSAAKQRGTGRVDLSDAPDTGTGIKQPKIVAAAMQQTQVAQMTDVCRTQWLGLTSSLFKPRKRVFS